MKAHIHLLGRWMCAFSQLFVQHSVLPQPSVGCTRAAVTGHFKPSLHRMIVVRVEILRRHVHVPVLRFAPVGAVFLGQLAQRLCGHARDERLRWDDLALRHERRLGHDAARAALELHTVRSEALCSDCHAVYDLIRREGKCPRCGSRDKTVLGGQDVRIRELRY